MTTSWQWISMKNLALFALLTTLSVCDPAPPFDEVPPGHARHRQGQTSPGSRIPPRPRIPRLQAPYIFVPPRIARKQGILPFDPENPRQRFPGFPEPPRGNEGKGLLPTPPQRFQKRPSVRPAPIPSHDDNSPASPDSPGAKEWSRTHDKFYLGRLDKAPAPKLPKPPKYSQARHPRVQKARFLGEQPLATFATSTA
ncbi:uncharacterized protein LOC119159969 [Rhipicephalus microplus]|uniref:uncharacterized protein LOC119159969 n=1 Tax=Rhipicephalus microplus TaxID=6941 RepID=UPI003F6D60A1